MKNKVGRIYCKECEISSIHHIKTWLDEIINLLPSLPKNFLFEKLGRLIDVSAEKFFTGLQIGSMQNDFIPADIQLRSTCFIEEARKQGIKFEAFYGPFGYTGRFQARYKDKIYRFEGLPIADFAGKYGSGLTDDKWQTKKHLKKRNFPIADGKIFWFWQKNKAIKFGINEIGFPLMVKPRSGSVSRHVTTNIRDIEKLRRAINKAVIYSPVFIVEKFISNTSVYRATVIDFDFVACVKQVPANIVGDGFLNIRELIDKKNNDIRRGEPTQKDFTLYKITEDKTTEKLLSEKGYNFSTIPSKGEIVYLQKDPFLKLGGDLVEETPKVHPDNIQLFRNIAKFFDIRVVGIDCLIKDITHSWKNQKCAVLELNSLPCIELHHFPSSGKPQNVADAIVSLFFKYYI